MAAIEMINPMHRTETSDFSSPGSAAMPMSGSPPRSPFSCGLSDLDNEPMSGSPLRSPSSCGLSDLDNERWCTGGSAVALGVVLFQLFILLPVRFALHCTPIADVLVEEKDTRELWLHIYLPVQAVVGILMISAFIFGFVVLVKITCKWKQTIIKERYARGHISRPSKWTFRLWYRFLAYYLGNRGPYFYRVQLFYETFELMIQTLAFHRYSQTGFSRAFLSVHMAVITANALTPIAMVWLLRRQTLQKNRNHLGKWTRRLLLFDCVCDSFYSSFGLVHLLAYRYTELFVTSKLGDEVDVCTKMNVVSPWACNEVKAHLIRTAAAETLLGGTTFREVLFKLVSRVFPMFSAFRKAMVAFRLRYVLTDDVEYPQLSSSQEQDANPPPTPPPPSSDRSSRTSTASKPRSSQRMSTRFVSALRRTMSNARHRAESGLAQLEIRERRRFYYYPVPLWLALIPVIVSVLLAISSWTRLALWSDCNAMKHTQAGDRMWCYERSFPVLSLPREGEFCSCNSVMYARRGACRAEGAQEYRDGCSAVDSSGGGNETWDDCSIKPFANAGVLRHATTIFLVNLCGSDIAHIPSILHEDLGPTATTMLYISTRFPSSSVGGYYFKADFGQEESFIGADDTWELTDETWVSKQPHLDLF